MQDIIPGNLLDKGKAGEFAIWLRSLQLDWQDKLTLLRLWADRVGVKVTGDMTAKILPK